MRTAVAGLAVGCALAVGVPATWALTRPPAAAGPPVEQVLDTPPPGQVTSDRPAVGARPAVVPAAATTVPPARLEVPSVGIDATVDAVGVEPDGSMTIPREVDRVGWYRFGPAPSSPAGNTVLAGHVDSAEQGTGAMAPLRGAEIGDELVVTDAAGAVSTWRVVSKETIEKRALPLTDLFARAGPPRLVLITCGGPFLADVHSYRDNVVVIAAPA